MGYKNKISRQQIIEAEIVNKLNKISRIGESRHEAKAEAKTSAVGQPLKYIYSLRTYDMYKESLERLAAYCLERHPEIKHIDDCRKYVPEYIDYMISEGYSSYTQKSRLSGYRKAFDDRFEDVHTESRKRSEIRRGRRDTLNARLFNEETHSDLVHFCKNTGLRRRELESLKGGCVSLHSDGNYYIDRVTGKGGKISDRMILHNDQAVIDKIMNTPPDQFVWGKVHSKANIHGYRADYCQALYESIARDVDTLDRKEIYVCRRDMAGIKLDRKAMEICSRNMAHNRIGIIAYNYLYGLKR